MKLLKITFSFGIALAASSCITLGGKDAPKNPDSLAEAAQGDMIVQQPRSKTPVVSKFARGYWLDIRSGAKSSIMRMHASLATGDASSAEGLARTYLEKNPGDADGLTVLAASLVLQKKYSMANYYAMRINKEVPGHPVADNIRGLAMMMKPGNRIKQFRQAKELFSAAFEGSGEQIAPGLNLGHLQLEMGNALAASETFAEVSNRCGKCIPGQMGVGIAASRSGKREEAVSAFESILDKKANHAKALYHLALVYKNRYNNSIKAQELLAQLLNKSQTNDLDLKDRADAVLNQMRGLASDESRTMLAEDETNESSDGDDAEALMTSSAMEE